MANSERFSIDGTVTSVIKGGKFKVLLDNGYETTCTIAGKLRINSIKIIVGDRVSVDLSPYSVDNGRITYRLKPNSQSSSSV